MSTRPLGFDDLRLERHGSSFRLSSKEDNTGIIRLHAFGRRDGRTTVAFHLTERRRWLSSGVISSLESGGLDEGSRVFDKVFYPELRVLRSRSAARDGVEQMLLQQGIFCPDILEGCSDSVAFFGSAAAGVAAATGCRAVVVVVEISLFRIYDDADEVGDANASSSPYPPVVADGLEVVQGWEGGSCAICLDDFDLGMELARLPCSHVYHGRCLGKWLEGTPSCPLCRRRVR